MDPMIEWLQDWYAGECNGDWEHSYGVHIVTLDNPGWALSIALEETALEGVQLSKVTRQNPSDEHDWAIYWVENNYFQGRGGPRNLQELLQVFRVWVESHPHDSPDRP